MTHPIRQLLLVLGLAVAQLLSVPLGAAGRCGGDEVLGGPCCCFDGEVPEAPSCCGGESGSDEGPSDESGCECVKVPDLPWVPAAWAFGARRLAEVVDDPADAGSAGGPGAFGARGLLVHPPHGPPHGPPGVWLSRSSVVGAGPWPAHSVFTRSYRI